MNSKINKLNLGCGLDKKIDDTWIHIDRSPLCNPDIVRDITLGLPFTDDTFDYVKADAILEHLGDDMLFVVSEVHRVCKPNAIFFIRVPHVYGRGAFQDPTHNRFFTDQTFKYFDHREILWKNFGRIYGIPKFEIVKQERGKMLLDVELRVIKDEEV